MWGPLACYRKYQGYWDFTVNIRGGWHWTFCLFTLPVCSLDCLVTAYHKREIRQTPPAPPHTHTHLDTEQVCGSLAFWLNLWFIFDVCSSKTIFDGLILQCRGLLAPGSSPSLRGNPEMMHSATSPAGQAALPLSLGCTEPGYRHQAGLITFISVMNQLQS